MMISKKILAKKKKEINKIKNPKLSLTVAICGITLTKIVPISVAIGDE